MHMPNILIDTGRSKFWTIENYTPNLYSQLCNLPLLEEPPIVVMGNKYRQRRNIGFFSNESNGYKYSGQIMISQPLNKAPLLEWLLPEINKSLNTNFNGILVNEYKDGTKHLGAHSDDEKGLDKSRNIVAGLAYGAVRKFRIRDKGTKKIVLDYEHTPGTLIVMEGDFQKEFTHEIPIQKKIKEPRISITFRSHLE